MVDERATNSVCTSCENDFPGVDNSISQYPTNDSQSVRWFALLDQVTGIRKIPNKDPASLMHTSCIMLRVYMFICPGSGSTTSISEASNMTKRLPVCIDRFSDVSTSRPRQIVMSIQPFIGI